MEQTARPRFRSAIAAGLALCAVSTPTFAQTGASSQLAAIMAAQANSAAAVAMTASLPSNDVFTQSSVLSVAAPAITVRQAASPTRPDIFNSVAMPIDRTPLDARWNRVGSASVGGAAAHFAATLRDLDQHARIEAVNAYVNARVTFVDDLRQFGEVDRWSAASETLGGGRGDCEDYALAKMAMLRRAGFADRDLYFVVLKDLVRRADHAVLVVRSEGRFLVLDNGTDRMMDSADVRDYRPILTFTAGQRFTHGYRRASTPPVIMASSEGIAREPGIVTIATSAGMPSSPFASR